MVSEENCGDGAVHKCRKARRRGSEICYNFMEKLGNNYTNCVTKMYKLWQNSGF